MSKLICGKFTVGENYNSTHDIIHNGLDVEYTDVQVESDISVQGKVTMESELKPIPLFKVPVYLGNGTVGVEIPVYLVVSAEGSVSIEAGMPVQLACEYISGNGFRPNVNINCHVNIEANCTAKGVLRIEPILQLSLLGILKVNVLDVEADIGIEASASTTARINSHIIGCTDLSVAAPIVSVEFLGDDDNPTLLSEILPSVSFDISDSETARFQANWHYEEYTDGTLLKVEECTYDKELVESMPSMDYEAYFDTLFVDKGDSYETTGRLTARVHITKDKIETMEPGEIYSFYGVEFILKEIKTSEASNLIGQVYYEFLDHNGNLYLVETWNYTENNGVREYNFILNEPKDAGVGSVFAYIVFDDEFLFKISKSCVVSISTGFEPYDSGGGSYKFEHLSVEEIYSKKIENYAGQKLGYDTGLYVTFLWFDDSTTGNVSSFSLADNIPNNHKYLNPH